MTTQFKTGDTHGDRWRIVDEIGNGGQGTVYKVLDEESHAGDFARLIRDASSKIDTRSEPAARELLALITEIASSRTNTVGALKVLRESDQAKDPENALERMHREILAMKRLNHPAFLDILDTDDRTFFVSQYFSAGTLAANRSRYQGDVANAVAAILPIVDALGELHQSGSIHRDIKPENIFVDSQGDLVLGDFGLIYSNRGDETRLSEEEMPGSWQWMPTWYQGSSIGEVQPDFDVYCVAKTLWSMISGKPEMYLWYYDRPENNIEALFPKNPSMQFINELFSECIVEHQEQCTIEDAGQLGAKLRLVKQKVEYGASKIAKKIVRDCRVCGLGAYQLCGDSFNDPNSPVANFGVSTHGDNRFRIYSCDQCGHLLTFHCLGDRPPLWAD